VFDLTAATQKRIRQNLGWAFCYNAVAVPTALFGALNPLVAAVAMGASSLLVVANSARGFDVDDGADGTSVGVADGDARPSVTPAATDGSP
jgi:Cu2+-exporting ATPase